MTPGSGTVSVWSPPAARRIVQSWASMRRPSASTRTVPPASATRRNRNQPWRSARIYRATTLTAPARVTAAADDRIGLGEQIAADLLPEAGDSGTVEGGEGL